VTSLTVSEIDQDIEVWTVPLDDLSTDASVLSTDEQERARRYSHDRDRDNFIRARRWLRTVLAGHLRVKPASIDIEYGPHGKPFVRYGGIHFNLAHSGSQAILAVSRAGVVGVDIERIDGVVYDRSAARHVLSTRELDIVDDCEDRELTFLRIWVRKEAFGKALGCGLDPMLPQLTLGLDPTSVCRGFRIVEIAAEEGCVAALAYDIGMFANRARHANTTMPGKLPILRLRAWAGDFSRPEALS
jgi:phosphopantetheinyl transferase